MPLGAAVSAVAITHGVNPFVSLALAGMAGFAAGAVTALLNTKLKILHLLASILTMIALYSINIRIMDGPNISLLGVATVLDPMMSLGFAGYVVAPAYIRRFRRVHHRRHHLVSAYRVRTGHAGHR